MEEYIINGKKVVVNLFDEIRDDNDAYLIGYLMCDGAYAANTHKRKHRISVSSTDTYIIDFFRDHYQPLTELRIKQPNDNKQAGIFGRRVYKSLTFSSLFSDKLEKYGVMNLKVNREIKGIPEEHFTTFLLGMFDADGNISYGYRKDRNRLWANFRITYPNKSVLETVSSFLASIGICSSTSKKKDENCYVLTVAKVSSVKKLYEYIYRNKPDVYNTDKFNKYS